MAVIGGHIRKGRRGYGQSGVHTSAFLTYIPDMIMLFCGFLEFNIALNNGHLTSLRQEFLYLH